MTRTTSYALSLILGFCTLFLINCKSDTNKTSSADADSSKSHVAALEKKNNAETDSLKSEIQSDTTAKSNPVDSNTVNENPLPITEQKETKPEKPAKSTKDKKPRKINRKKPKIEFEELTWNFGEITEGDIVEKKFKFTNTGKAPLQILSTSATCGCTMPSFPFLDIAPGESNVIGVTYNSVGKEGKQTPEVTIESNTNPKITILTLQGFVKPK